MSEAEAALRLRAAKRSSAARFPSRSRCWAADTLSLLHEARFKTKPQVLALIAKHAAKPDAPDSIRRLPRPSVREASAHWFAPGEGSSLINRFTIARMCD